MYKKYKNLMKRFDYILNSFFISVETSSTVIHDLDDTLISFRNVYSEKTFAVEVLNYKIHT